MWACIWRSICGEDVFQRTVFSCCGDRPTDRSHGTKPSSTHPSSSLPLLDAGQWRHPVLRRRPGRRRLIKRPVFQPLLPGRAGFLFNRCASFLPPLLLAGRRQLTAAMAGNDKPSLDLDGDSSGDFVLPTRRVVSRKKTNSPSDVRKGRPKGDDVNSGGLTLDSCFSVNNTVMFFLRSWVRRSSYRNVLSSFVGQKKQLLESIGFGGLLSMHKQPRISHCLAFWLLRNMDNASSSIVTRDGVKIHVKDADANLVLGLPHKLVKITLGLGKHANIRMECIECNPGSQLVCLSAYVVRVAKEASVKVKHALSSGKKSVSLDLLAISRDSYLTRKEGMESLQWKPRRSKIMASAADSGTLTNPATSNDRGRCSTPRGIIMAGVAGVAELPSMAAGGGSGPSDMVAAAAWDGGPPAYIASMAAAADGAPPTDLTAMAAAGNGLPPTGPAAMAAAGVFSHNGEKRTGRRMAADGGPKHFRVELTSWGYRFERVKHQLGGVMVDLGCGEVRINGAKFS
ncbi:hypothetical protein EJB05_44707, partial [Eragrostis curvula]